MLLKKCKASWSAQTVTAFVGIMSFAGGMAAGLQVRHDHDPWGACVGELSITAEGIRYTSAEKPEHDRQWTWLDIQTVDRRSPERFTILTYEDQRLLLGRDRPWDFTVVEPSSGVLDDALWAVITEHLKRPVIDRMVPRVQPAYEVPVKHLHTLGGCEGVLQFTPNWIIYRTDHPEDQRSWRRDREVLSVLSTGRYDLEVEVYEKEGQDLLHTRRFRFQLKQPLDERFYRELRRALVAEH